MAMIVNRNRVAAVCRMWLAAVAVLLWACTEDSELGYGPSQVEEGMPATVALSVQLPGMTPVSRAAGVTPDNDATSMVHDLWVAVYNSASGMRTGVYRYDFNEKFEHNHNQGSGHHEIEIDALSGMCYIVAVANASVNAGTVCTPSLVEIAGEDAFGKRYDMTALLEAADTWEKYKSVSAVLMGDAQNIQHAGSDFLMSGIYYTDHQPHKYQSVVDAEGNPTPVAITPNMNKLGGCIQLRRTAAYVKFYLRSAYENLMSVTPVSWQVCNLPALSYVHERGEGNNAADKKMDLSGIFRANAGVATYNNSAVQEASSFVPERRNDNGEIVQYSFDFYQLENKHTARPDAPLTGYNDREREFKSGDGDGTNTGWYTSLVGSEGPEMPGYGEWSNNNATFVTIRAHVEYYYEQGDDEYKPVAPDDPGRRYIRRVGEAVFTVHLGYCETTAGFGNMADSRIADFNCRRNTSYTYNVYVYGVDKIRVEAMKEGEDESGSEGTVTDMNSTPVNLDSHYGVFNIELTDAQRMNMIWRIRAPFDNEYIDLICGNIDIFEGGNYISMNPDNRDERYMSLPTNQFYNWIQVRPTTGKDVLAHYPGDPRLRNRKIRNDDDADGTGEYYYPTDKIKDYAHIAADGTKADDGNGVWYLETFRDLVNFPHPDVENDAQYLQYLAEKLAGGGVNVPHAGDEIYKSRMIDEKRWYTVFVDEYVYEYERADEPDLTKGDYTDEADLMSLERWATYVNKDKRQAWIALSNTHVSDDFESTYSNAVYLISQESIQTYYSDSAPRGIGIEITNESYRGENFDYSDYNNSNYDAIDGLLNQYHYVVNPPNRFGQRLEWSELFASYGGDVNGPTHRPRVGVLRNGTIEHPDNTFYIADNGNHYMDACLARNRDLNNDGFIGANEIRWYLPTDATYTRMMLGSPSLRTPLFQLNLYPRDYVLAGVGAGFTHYAASNARMLWAEELAAVSNIKGGWVDDAERAQTLRCIRNIGQEMNLTPNDPDDGYETIDPAYEVDAANHTVTLHLYRSTALRGYTESSLPLHDVSEILSYASAKFKYAKAICSSENIPTAEIDFIDDYGQFNSNATFEVWDESLRTNSVCGLYSEEPDGRDKGLWRVPNITEIGILKMTGRLDSKRYISSTREYFYGREYTDGEPTFMGIVGANIAAWNSNAYRKVLGEFYLRCVRDVE